MFTLEMIGINSTENKFTSFFLFSIPIEPEWEDRLFNKTLIYHIIPKKITDVSRIDWFKQEII